jgi:hypothetical protein
MNMEDEELTYIKIIIIIIKVKNGYKLKPVTSFRNKKRDDVA